jgi:transposase-like protein
VALSDEEIKKYVDRQGLYCPYCDSMELQVGHLSSEESGVYINIVCRDCGKEWTEEFTLTWITEV